jgi:hypothetical protein
MTTKRAPRTTPAANPEDARMAKVSTFAPGASVPRDRQLETLWLRIDQPFVATVLVPVHPITGDEVLDLAKRLARTGAVIEDREVALADFRGVSPHAADRTRTVIERMAAAGPLLLVVDPLTDQHGGIPVVESAGRALLVVRLGSSTAGAIAATQQLIPSRCDTAVVCLEKGHGEPPPATRRDDAPRGKRHGSTAPRDEADES